MAKVDTPLDIARQTLLQLSKQKMMPTPDNFRNVYNEIAGLDSSDHDCELTNSFKKVMAEAHNHHNGSNSIFRTIDSLIDKQDWPKLETQLLKLVTSTDSGKPSTANWSVIIRTLLKQLETSHKGITISRKKEGLHRVLSKFGLESDLLGEKILALVSSWGQDQNDAIETQTASGEAEPSDTPTEAEFAQVEAIKSDNMWRQMMLEIIELEFMPNLEEIPEAHKKASAMLEEIRQTNSQSSTDNHVDTLKSILLVLETQRDERQRIKTSLLNLLRLLTESMDELVIEDDWLHSQIGIISDIINKPININTLYDAEASLKDLIQKQLNLKPALHDARDTLKQMLSTFVSGLAVMTESTSDYHAKIENYQQKLSNTENIEELNDVLHSILEDTKNVGLSVQKSRSEFQEIQKKAQEAEQKIISLSAELDHIHEVAHEDYLTGTLNRRGMDEALEKEFSRADRYNTALSIAMMDIDHFKQLNDKLGHAKGDEALTHFAKVVKQVKRTTDVLARYGGEEFVIILPGTKQEDAIDVIARVQRELTKNFFMSNDEHVLITFSAGVAERLPGESPDSIVPRADAALYKAKNSGRNRVVGAEVPSQSSGARGRNRTGTPV
ncbi:MAG TPA: GGDEF domain-containing protein [Methylophilus sp.]|nr:GGDEF domain-containing protein [Methylophilus sp.]